MSSEAMLLLMDQRQTKRSIIVWIRKFNWISSWNFPDVYFSAPILVGCRNPETYIYLYQYCFIFCVLVLVFFFLCCVGTKDNCDTADDILYLYKFYPWQHCGQFGVNIEMRKLCTYQTIARLHLILSTFYIDTLAT